MKLKTLTIGIPAYNEEANIKNILLSLLSQKQTNYILEKILVISDGSTDGTVKKVKTIRSKKIHLILNKKRLGLNETQNRILNFTKSEVLIIANADIFIEDDNFVDKLIRPFYEDQNLGIVSTGMIGVVSNSLVSKILAYAQIFKETIYKKINKSNNIYLCHGQLRAFSKKFYSQFKWEENCPEDAYSYVACIKNGYKFKYLTELKVYYKPSQTAEDHALQSNRFIFGIDKLKEIFGSEVIEKYYYIPSGVFLGIFLRHFLKNPLLTLSYILMMLYIRFFKKSPPTHHSKFKIATTSKILFMQLIIL